MIVIQDTNKKDKATCSIHVKSSTHERLMRRKKDGSETFDNVIVGLLDENIELKRKLRAKDGAKDGKKDAAIRIDQKA